MARRRRKVQHAFCNFEPAHPLNETCFSGEVQLCTARLLGEGGRRIDYRHVIASLVRKPGAFERWRYREDLFPTLTFRKAFDALHDELEGRRADSEYLRILKLAADTVECDVEQVIRNALSAGTLPLADEVRAQIVDDDPVVPDLAAQDVDLTAYNQLLSSSIEELQPPGRRLEA